MRSGHSPAAWACCGTPRDRGRKWSRLRSPALLCWFVCSLIEAGCDFQSRYSARSTRAPGSPPATVFCARVWMSVRPPKGASGTVQSRAFAPEATLCVKNVKQSKVRWMRAVLASRTELVCASNATAGVPDCDTGHEGEFLIYPNYGESISPSSIRKHERPPHLR